MSTFRRPIYASACIAASLAISSMAFQPQAESAHNRKAFCGTGHKANGLSSRARRRKNKSRKDNKSK